MQQQYLNEDFARCNKSLDEQKACKHKMKSDPMELDVLVEEVKHFELQQKTLAEKPSSFCHCASVFSVHSVPPVNSFPSNVSYIDEITISKITFRFSKSQGMC